MCNLSYGGVPETGPTVLLLERLQTQESDVVRIEVLLEDLLGGADVLLVPDVADRAVPSEEPPAVAKIHLHVGRRLAAVEHGNRPFAAGELTHPDFVGGVGSEAPAFLAQ